MVFKHFVFAKLSSLSIIQCLVFLQWAPKLNDFHAMDCIDLIMGAARGSLSRIRDYYTRDRSTPRVDTFWGGKEDITSATGWEEEGKTILIFRRRIISTDSFDHDLVGDMHVIWARGQENGEYVHSPKSGLERDNPHRPDFYAPDEIKYHGHGGQRGKTRIDFLNEQGKMSHSFAISYYRTVTVVLILFCLFSQLLVAKR